MTHTTEEPVGLIAEESVGLIAGELVGLVVEESVGLTVGEPVEQHQSFSQRHHLHRCPRLLRYHLELQC